jgi:hypothetical protein
MCFQDLNPVPPGSEGRIVTAPPSTSNDNETAVKCRQNLKTMWNKMS